MLFSMVNSVLALPDLDLMTQSVVPCLSTTLLRYMKDFFDGQSTYCRLCIGADFHQFCFNDVARRVVMSRI